MARIAKTAAKRDYYGADARQDTAPASPGLWDTWESTQAGEAIRRWRWDGTDWISEGHATTETLEIYYDTEIDLVDPTTAYDVGMSACSLVVTTESASDASNYWTVEVSSETAANGTQSIAAISTQNQGAGTQTGDSTPSTRLTGSDRVFLSVVQTGSPPTPVKVKVTNIYHWIHG
jgi:hypothetical protein